MQKLSLDFGGRFFGQGSVMQSPNMQPFVRVP